MTLSVENKPVESHWYVDCANCGRQTLVEGIPGELCGFGNHSPYKKEDIIMSETNQVTIVTEVPTRPHKRKQLIQYFEDNREAIIKDYETMLLAAFLKRWGISTGSWIKLKKLWGVAGKTKVSNRERSSVYRKHLYMEEHKEEMKADLEKLSKPEFLSKWSISSTSYFKLTRGMKRVKTNGAEEPPASVELLGMAKAGEGTAPLTEHERYLILIGYQQATREFLGKKAF